MVVGASEIPDKATLIVELNVAVLRVLGNSSVLARRRVNAVKSGAKPRSSSSTTVGVVSKSDLV
jgi:hypothetical protein